MREPIKKRGYSLWSFLSAAAKMAGRRAWSHYGNLLVIVSLLQCALLVSSVSKITKGIDVNFWLTFSPVIISVIAFLAFLFRETHKIYERALNSEQSNSENIPESEPPKPAMFILFIVTVLICVVLVAAIITVQRTQIEHLQSQVHSPKQAAAEPKPLPDTIIPSPEPPPVVPALQVASVQPQIQWETNTADFGDIESELERSRIKLRDDNAARIQAETLQNQKIWTNNLTVYNYTLETLYDILNDEATSRKDGISKTPGYFQCLPTTNPASKVSAEIRLQIQTNLDFKIAVSGAGSDISGGSTFKITCSCGQLSISTGERGRFSGIFMVHVSIPEYSDAKSASNQECRDFIKHSLKILVAGQNDYLSNTNRTQ